MSPHFLRLKTLACLIAAFSTSQADAKPLKVFILCGQSNMEGHAQTMTFPAMAKDPSVADLYKEMIGADGKPIVCDDVWVSYAYGDFGGNPIGKKVGKLTAGFGSQHHVGTGKIGPEFSFGITMQKELNEPILLIKNAWGGKSLMVNFRPPSAGEIDNERAKAVAGDYYDHTINHVKEVLADPKQVYPDYDPKEGYELAGFVWFQGFNDMVGDYPRVAPEAGKKSPKDYSEYSRLLACLIRDVRKDLSAPELPFVIGVIGVDGDQANENVESLRKSMAAPAETEEFKGTVANVFTHTYWPTELDDVLSKVSGIKNAAKAQSKKLKNGKLPAEEIKAKQTKLAEETQAKIKQALTEDELFLLQNGISNQAFHYHGSAKFFARVGQAFAKALLDLDKRH